ncbi:MAG: hypothetical protein IJ864_02590 [Alphaproteobacteria bacterium]|nr:hypothetical protein [Alphaproteobacteria bacterium]
MEIYLLITLAFIYFLTVILLPQKRQRQIWTTAYIVSFIITAISIGYIKIYADETLMKVGELNWYYILYIFGSISIILGLINLWMYKSGLINLFRNSKDDEA